MKLAGRKAKVILSSDVRSLTPLSSSLAFFSRRPTHEAVSGLDERLRNVWSRTTAQETSPQVPKISSDRSRARKRCRPDTPRPQWRRIRPPGAEKALLIDNQMECRHAWQRMANQVLLGGGVHRRTEEILRRISGYQFRMSEVSCAAGFDSLRKVLIYVASMTTRIDEKARRAKVTSLSRCTGIFAGTANLEIGVFSFQLREDL